MLATLVAILTLAVLYWFPVRRWFARWGATPEDVNCIMAGDAVIRNPTHSATHAVTVDVPPEDVWPWLVQMGYRRGGLYSYDWLDRLFGFLDRPSADRILPECQHLAVGDTIRLGPREALTVAALEPDRALVLSYQAHGFEWVWQFGLCPLGANRTRLVTRGTERYANTVGTWLFMRVMEPAAFIMTRRMLLGVKERAEALRSPAERPMAHQAERRIEGMSTITAFVTRHPVLAYFALTFAISWGAVLAIGGRGGISGATWQSDPRLPFLVMAMLAGPSVAGLVLTAVVSGRAGLRALLARLLRWRVGGRWYAVALLAAPLVFAAVHLTLSLVSPVFLPSIVTMSGTASLLLFSIAGALTVGILEELGWTGFATPTLRRRYSAFATALIVGVPWGAWHLLTNDMWIAGTYSGELSVGLFVTLNGLTLLIGQLPAYRVLMVWVYDRTDSLLVAMLMHASLSACTFALGPERLTGLALVGYGLALAAAWWTVVAVIAAVTRRWVVHHPIQKRAA
jgi:uncharacterized protein